MGMKQEKMELEFGKLFIGGISWDTDEGRLKEYFGSYGEVIEAVIMRDRITGRARGFGFVVFADPVVAEKVVLEKHIIGGRTVEAKKAVPREDHHGLNRNNGSVHGSPGPGERTKKIFVGGLASTVTESDFKKYFDQFGEITDVVVMYDHNTQRPRGFGFITFDSEEEVDRVLIKTFHELNGKMVEVKRAVPKQLSTAPNLSPLIGLNHGLTRPNTMFTGTYPQGYSMSSNGSYGLRTNSRISPIGEGRNGFSPFRSSAYGMGMNLEPDFNPSSFESTSNTMQFGRVLSSQFSGNTDRYITPIGHSVRNEPFVGSSTGNVWGNSGLTNPGGLDVFGVFANESNWGSSSIPTQGGVSSSGYNSNGPIGAPENKYGFSVGQNGSNIGHERSYGKLYRGGSMYVDPAWQSSPADLNGLDLGRGSFSYEFDNSEDVGNHSIANRQTNRGIAA